MSPFQAIRMEMGVSGEIVARASAHTTSTSRIITWHRKGTAARNVRPPEAALYGNGSPTLIGTHP